nr:MAG TPA: hypothetical protein [Caudoviricetes sp.]
MKGKVTITMNPLPTELMNTPDFWLLLLSYAFMGEEKFRELLESMKNEETSDTLEKKEGDYHV